MNSKEETFEEIYRICVPKLMAYLQYRSYSQHDAEDIVSRAVKLLWERWDEFSTHSLKGILCWLLNTVRNIAHEEDRHRAQMAQILNLDDLPPHMHPPAPSDIPPEEREAEYQRLLRRLTEQLSDGERELLLDKIERHRTDTEIAAQLGITVNAVRIRWMRLKERISRILQNGSDTDQRKV